MKRIKQAKLKWPGVFRIVLLAVCGTILGVNLYLLNTTGLIGNRLPMPFGYGAAVVLSGSMNPTLSTDDLIIVKKTDSLAVGDIIVYQEESSLVVHRIIEIDGETITTKGDANDTADEPINIPLVKGKVVFRIPFVGKMVNFIKTPVGTLLVILAAIALIEIPHRNEKKQYSEDRQKIIDEIDRLKQERHD